MKIKKIIIAISVISIVILTTFIFINVGGVVNGTEGLTYTLSEDKSYYIVSDEDFKSKEHTIIPESYKGLPVKEIANDAFAERYWIEEITIPKTIEKIGHGAFSMTGLKKVNYNAINCKDFDTKNWVFYPTLLDQELEENGNRVLDEKERLELTRMTIIIGKDVKKIPNRFLLPLGTVPTLNPNVEAVKFDEESKLEVIGDYAFYQLKGLKNIILPPTLKEIGSYAFYGNNLSSIIFNDGLETIKEHAFDNSLALIKVELPQTIKTISDGVFRNCRVLTSFKTTSPNYQIINKDTFKYCISLSEVEIDKIISVEESAFEGCISLKQYDFNNVESIGESAFKDCKGLEKIILNNELKYLHNSAFSGCINVKRIDVLSEELNSLTNSNKVFLNVGSGTEGLIVYIGNGVKVLPQRLFLSSIASEEQPNINKIIIDSSSLTKIDMNAFGNLNAEITYVGKISDWNKVSVEFGNDTFKRVECVKNLEEE